MTFRLGLVFTLFLGRLYSASPINSLAKTSYSTATVQVLYYASNNWVDEHIHGDQKCSKVHKCNWIQSSDINVLKEKFGEINAIRKHSDYNNNNTFLTLALFNVHSLWDKFRSHHPINCDWKTNLTMACSEESGVRYNHIFNHSFPNFDGYSTNHPSASVQRIHKIAYFTENDINVHLYNFSYLIKAASYVAKDCHHKDTANANRDGIIHQIRLHGFRIDGLSKCMHSQNLEGITLQNSGDTVTNLALKREVISRFMFNMAFENSLEDGYVTEKPFDALLAGKLCL